MARAKAYFTLVTTLTVLAYTLSTAKLAATLLPPMRAEPPSCARLADSLSPPVFADADTRAGDANALLLMMLAVRLALETTSHRARRGTRRGDAWGAERAPALSSRETALRFK